MYGNIEQITQRKENINSIEPLLSAMRTISLSNWRSSLNREIDLRSFIAEIKTVYAILMAQTNRKASTYIIENKIVYALGSNRGLCGNFNKNIKNFFIKENLVNNSDQEIALIGAQLFRLFNRENIHFNHKVDFPDIKHFHELAFTLCSSAAKKLDKTSISVVYNNYIGASTYSTIVRQIYPIAIEIESGHDAELNRFIFDTDPIQLIKTIEFLLLAANLQQCFLSSLAAESSARFANMENAGNNLEDLSDELEIIIQDQRRSKITTETQELAVSSGLLG